MAAVRMFTRFLLAGLLIFHPSACAADGEIDLTYRSTEGETTLRIHGEIELWQAEPWRLELYGTAPGRITADDDAYLGLSLVRTGEDWRWTMAGRRTWRTSGAVEALQLRGSYSRSPWSLSLTLGEQDMSDPAAENGLEVYAARRMPGGWRVALRQEAARVTTQVAGDRYRRYRSDLTASWRRGNLWAGAAVGGSTARYEIAANDRASRYAELALGIRLDPGWILDAGARLDWDWAAGAWSMERSLGLGLIRLAPLGLRLQADLEAGEDGKTLRAGVTASGSDGGLYWRLGGAGERGEDTGAWLYGVCGWRTKTWEIALGLTPEGEYAVNSRKGYWLEVSYSF